jgi:methionine-rich copper-binding protein CopC
VTYVRRINLSAAARLSILTPVAVLVVAGSSVALAHGILESASPAPDSTASKSPRVVTTTLTEDPVPDGRYIVRDGCGRIVSKAFSVEGDTISARTPDGQPGKWQVRFDFISSADGHRYNETYSFSVKGKKDCSAPEDPVAEDDSADEAGGTDTPSNASGSSHEETGGATHAGNSDPEVPAIPLTIASAAAIGLALLGRKNPATN